MTTTAAVEEVARIIDPEAFRKDDDGWFILPDIRRAFAYDTARRILALPSVGWRTIDTYPNDNSVVLVANPNEGTLPVIAWKVEDTWYPYDPRNSRALDPQPTLWMSWPKIGPPQPVEDRP